MVAVEGTCIADIDHCLVHADATYDIVAVVVDDHLRLIRECTPISVRVTNWERDDPGGIAWRPCAAVTDRVPSFNHFEVDDFATPGQHRLKFDCGGFVGRCDPV